MGKSLGALVVLLLFVFAGAPSRASVNDIGDVGTISVEFTPKLAVWDCPAGYRYLILECKSQETVFAKQHVTFLDAGDGFWVGTWEATASGVLTSYNEISFLIYPNRQGVVHLQVDFRSGFEPDTNRDPGAFFEALPENFPDWLLITGERRANGPREAVATLEYDDLKFLP